eukprot:gene10532-11669_t
MSSQGIYEEVEIEDMIFQAESGIFQYPCPCGDKFAISLDDLFDGEDIAHCPSCTLKIRIIFDDDVLADYEDRHKAALAKAAEGSLGEDHVAVSAP